VESIGGAPPWGSGANRPPPEDYGPVKGLLLYLNYRKSVADCALGHLVGDLGLARQMKMKSKTTRV
jgi:hypothetical protein